MGIVFQIVLGIMALAVSLPIVFVAVVCLISIAALWIIKLFDKKLDL